MLILFTISLLLSLMLALTAFLQADSSWWKGSAVAIILFVLGYLNVLAAFSPDDFDPNQPVLSLSVAAWVCGAAIFVGSISALVLRPFFSPGKVAGRVFVGGFALIFLGLLTNAFT